MAKCLLAGMLLFLAAACASIDAQNPGASSYEGVGIALERVVTTYQGLEPQLTSAQREEFKNAYGDIVASYQTAGRLLVAAIEAVDTTNAHTAMVAYQRIVDELPARVIAASKLLQTFKSKGATK